MHSVIDKVKNITEKEYDLFGIFLIGSQNYNLDLENSDFDTAAIVLPTIDNLYYGDKYIQDKVIKYNEGQCKIIDIRDFYKGLTKSNLNYVELLYSKEFWVNEDYEIYYNYLRTHREIISNIDKRGLINCALGIVNTNHKKEIDWLSINDNGHYKAYHILRMCNFIYSFIKGKTVEECFLSEDIFSHKVIKDFKEKSILPMHLNVEGAKEMVNKYLSDNLLNIKQSDLLCLREVFNDILDKHFDF